MRKNHLVTQTLRLLKAMRNAASRRRQARRRLTGRGSQMLKMAMAYRPMPEEHPDVTGMRVVTARYTRAAFWSAAAVFAAIIVSIAATVVSAVLSTRSLDSLAETNRSALRAQFYSNLIHELELQVTDDDFTTLWAIPRLDDEAPTAEDHLRRTRAMLKPLMGDGEPPVVRTAPELFHALFGSDVLEDKTTREATKRLRRMFTYTALVFYDLANVFDYAMEGTITPGEWCTWRSTLLDMAAHPMFYVVLWDSARNHYLSRYFARFIKDELLMDGLCPAQSQECNEARLRNRPYVRAFFPDIEKPGWGEDFPAFYSKTTAQMDERYSQLYGCGD